MLVLIVVWAMVTSDVDLEVIAKCMGHEVEHWCQEEAKAGCHCLRAHKPHQQVAEEVMAENHVNQVNEEYVVVITNKHHYNNQKYFKMNLF